MKQSENFCILPNSLLPAMSELSKGEIRALIGVLSFRDPNSTNLAFPSINTIAKRCGMTPSYCSKQLNRIAERGGILEINRRFNNSNTYDFVWTGCTPPVQGALEPPVHVPLPNRPSNRPLSIGEFLKQYPKPSPPSGWQSYIWANATKEWKDKGLEDIKDQIFLDIRDRLHREWRDVEYWPNPATYLKQQWWTQPMEGRTTTDRETSDTRYF